MPNHPFQARSGSGNSRKSVDEHPPFKQPEWKQGYQKSHSETSQIDWVDTDQLYMR